MRDRLISYTAVSAMLGGFAYVATPSCWWFVFIFLIPLCIRVGRAPMPTPWVEGLWWGFIFFSMQSAWIFTLMIQKTGCPWLGVLLAIFFVSYCSLYTAVWFGTAAWLSEWRNTPSIRVASILLVGLGTFYWLERGAFWVTGQWDGYPLVQPLLCLAEKPATLVLIPWLGTYGLLTILFALSGAAALFVVAHWAYGVAVLCLAIPFCLGTWYGQGESQPDWVGTIGYIRPQQGLPAYAQIQAIAQTLATAHARDPQKRLFVMPESMLGIALNDDASVIAAWDVALSHDPVALVLGAHSREGHCWFNTVYGIQQGRIIATYRKAHCVPFVEYMPFPWSLVAPLRKLFLGDCYSFERCCRPREPVPLAEGFVAIPYICSELYFCHQPPETPAGAPLICLVNDSWFVPYARHLLWLLARQKAMAWRRVIIYIGHYFGMVMWPNGSFYLLQEV